jgi:hypothetical protein
MGLFDNLTYAFNGNAAPADPSSYRALDLRRQIALAAMAQGGRKGYPKNLGEGLSAIGDAIGERSQLSALNQQLAGYDKYVRDNPEPKASDLLRQQDQPQQRSEVAPAVQTADVAPPPSAAVPAIAQAAAVNDAYQPADALPPVADAGGAPQMAALNTGTMNDAAPVGVPTGQPNPAAVRDSIASLMQTQRQGVPQPNPMLAGQAPAGLPSAFSPADLGSPPEAANNRPIVAPNIQVAGPPQAATAPPSGEPPQPREAPHNPLELQGADLQQRGLRSGDRDMAARGEALMRMGKDIRDKQNADAMEKYKLNYQTWQSRSNPIAIEEAKIKAQEADVANRFGGAVPYHRFVEDMSKSYDATQQLSNTMPTLRQAKQALAQSYTGSGADLKLDAGKMLRQLGVPGDYTPEVATELLASRMKAIAGGMIKSTVGSQNISDADRDFVEKAYSGKISMEPESIRRLLSIAEDTTIRSINRHNDRLHSVASDPEKDKPLRNQYRVPMQYGDDAVAYLKAHPETADLFDKKFGKGHAKAILQGTPYGQ